jgi:hypothetical protein
LAAERAHPSRSGCPVESWHGRPAKSTIRGLLARLKTRPRRAPNNPRALLAVLEPNNPVNARRWHHQRCSRLENVGAARPRSYPRQSRRMPMSRIAMRHRHIRPRRAHRWCGGNSAPPRRQLTCRRLTLCEKHRVLAIPLSRRPRSGPQPSSSVHWPHRGCCPQGSNLLTIRPRLVTQAVDPSVAEADKMGSAHGAYAEMSGKTRHDKQCEDEPG